MTPCFEQWLAETDGTTSRRDQAKKDLGPQYEKWLLAAWVGGMECADPVLGKEEGGPSN